MFQRASPPSFPPSLPPLTTVVSYACSHTQHFVLFFYCYTTSRPSTSMLFLSFFLSLSVSMFAFSRSHSVLFLFSSLPPIHPSNPFILQAQSLFSVSFFCPCLQFTISHSFFSLRHSLMLFFFFQCITITPLTLISIHSCLSCPEVVQV